MRTFTRNLRSVMSAGDLSVTDLAVWFERPFHTVRWWTLGKVPVGAGGRDAAYRLTVLARQFGVGRLPVPPRLTWRERTMYITKLRKKAFGDEPGISPTYSAAKRRVRRLVKEESKQPTKDVSHYRGIVGVDPATE